MKIEGEKIEIAHVPYDDKGDKLEPEQQPARRLLYSPVDTKFDGGTDTGHQMSTFISVEMTAEELAQGIAKPCRACRHFNKKAALEWYNRAQQTPAGIEILRQFAAEHPNLDELGPERAFGIMGVCNPMSELARETMLVHPDSTCPETVRDWDGQACKFGSHFVPDDRTEEKNSSTVKDQIMRKAEGRIL